LLPLPSGSPPPCFSPIRPLLPATATDHPDPPDRTQNHRRHSADLARSSSRRLPPRTVGKTMVSDRFLRELWPAVSPSSGHQSGRVRYEFQAIFHDLADGRVGFGEFLA
ncbi:unnamed protein product, partial [Prunus armeniaca]